MPLQARRLVNLAILMLLPWSLVLWGGSAALAPAQESRPAASSPPAKSILFVYSAGLNLPAYRRNLHSFMGAIDQAGYPVSRVYIEQLDLARNSGPEYGRLLLQMFHQKYAAKDIGLIVTLEGMARDFILGAAGDIFPRVPVLAVMSSNVLEEVDQSRRVVQIPGISDVAETLKMALSLLPATKRVFVVVGHGKDEKRWELDARLRFQPWAGELEFEYSSDLTYEETLDRARTLPAGSIVIFIAFFRDKTDRSFVSAEVVRKVSESANAPVFGVYDQILGLVVGGAMLSYGDEGARSARLAMDILNGEFPLTKPLTTLPLLVTPKFNHDQLRRWGIHERTLPEGSLVINRPSSIWRDYKAHVVAASAAILLQAAMIILLVVMHRRRKKSEASRLEAESRYRQIVELSSEGIWTIDDALGLTFMNRQGAALLGYEPEELLGRSVESLVYPDDLESHRASMAKRRQGIGEEYERRWVRKDGQVIWSLVKATPLFDERGEYRGSFGMLTDITERKRAEAALRLSEEKFAKTFNASPVWVSVSTIAEGLIMEVNDTFTNLTGFTREEVIGRTSVELGLLLDPPRDRARVMEIARRDGRFYNLEMPMRFKDGQVHHMLWSAEAMELAGTPCLLNVLVDITEHKRTLEEKGKLEIQFRQAQKMEALGTLAGGIAHDFNNILGAIMGYAEMAQRRALGGRPNQTELAQVIQSAERARDLVKRILTFSRKAEADLRPMDLNKCLRDTLRMLEHSLPKMVAIESHLDPSLRQVMADSNQMEQVIMNLATNAADAMPDGGRLIWETSNIDIENGKRRLHQDLAPGRYVLLMVTDTGKGIPPEIAEHIFEPFFTTKEVGKGTGLGLSTAYGIVSNHGGRLACYSEPGMGATFKIYLPAIKNGSVETSGGGQPSQEMLRGSETILFVDDEPTIRELGTNFLADFGYQTLTASTGEEAVEIYRSRPGHIALVVMDLGMPGMGGHRALQDILDIDPRAKVIISSGYSAFGRVTSALDSGAAGYVAKPFRQFDLLGVVRRILDERK